MLPLAKLKGFFCSLFNNRSPEDALGKLSFFAHVISQKRSANQQNNYRRMLFMSKQVSPPKISSILQKIKIGPKSDLCPFCTKTFNYRSFKCKCVHNTTRAETWKKIQALSGIRTHDLCDAGAVLSQLGYESQNLFHTSIITRLNYHSS